MLVIVLAGAAGWLVVTALRMRRIYAAGAIALLAVNLGLGAQATFAKFVENMNGRVDVYSESEIRADLEVLPADASIVWPEPDISMMAALLEGAWRFRVLPYPMIEGSPSENAVLEQWRPDYIAAPVPRSFNTRSLLQSKTLSPRFYGISLADVSELTVHFGEERPSRLLMRLSEPPRKGDLKVAGAGGPCSSWKHESVDVAGVTWLARPGNLRTRRLRYPTRSAIQPHSNRPQPRNAWREGQLALGFSHDRLGGGARSAPARGGAAFRLGDAARSLACGTSRYGPTTDRPFRSERCRLARGPTWRQRARQVAARASGL